MKRPITIWIVLLTFSVIIATLTFGVIYGSIVWFNFFYASPDAASSHFLEFLIPTILRLIIVIYLLYTIFYIWKRNPLGRKLGIVAFIALYLLMAYIQLSDVPIDNRPRQLPKSDPRFYGAFIFFGLLYLSLCVSFYSSRKSIEYFENNS